MANLDCSNDIMIDSALYQQEKLDREYEWAFEDAESKLLDSEHEFNTRVLQSFGCHKTTEEELDQFSEGMRLLFSATRPEGILAAAKVIKLSHQRFYDKAVIALMK
jgi:hypothetical protein